MRARFECDRSWIRDRIGSKLIYRLCNIVFTASPLSMQYQGVRSKTGWFGTRSMCPSGATCLPADCCFSVLALYKPLQNKRVGLVQSGYHYHLIECNLFSPKHSRIIAHFWRLNKITHSLQQLRRWKIVLACGKHLHDRLITLREEIWTH